jgi:hypothetical protein
MSDRVRLIADAQRKGFAVVPNEAETGWLIVVPARPRNPMHTQGEFRTPERAWMTACLIAADYPDCG